MPDKQQALITASAEGDLTELQILWNDLSEDEREDMECFRSVLRAAAKARHVSVVQYLLSQKLSFTIDRDTAFAVATGGSTEVYKELYKVDPDVVSISFGHTGDPITVAVQTKNVPVLRFLLEKEADPNAGWFLSRLSPIALAATCSTEEIISLLIESGAQIKGSNALQCAISSDHMDILSCLLSHGADANDAPDYHHRPKLFDHLETPLHTAVRAKRHDMVELLLNYGGDPTLRDSDGKSVFEMAQKVGQPNIIEALQAQNE